MISRYRLDRFVRTLTRSHSRTPSVLVESIIYQESILSLERLERFTGSNRALHRIFRALQSDGVPNLQYVCGADLLGDDGEATVDGSHPNDVGMVRYADAYEKEMRKLLP